MCAPVRILLAGEVAMMRGALAALIAREPDLEVIAEAERDSDILPTALANRPAVTIIDTDRATNETLATAMQLHEQLPSCRTLILSTVWCHGACWGALPAAADGFLLKEVPADRLADAIRDVASGERVVEPHVPAAGRRCGWNPLSQREHAVLRMVALGAEPGEIAGELHLSVGTVRNYLTAVVAKLEARNRIDAIVKAYEAGWLP